VDSTSSVGTPTTELKRNLEIAGKKMEERGNGMRELTTGAAQSRTNVHTGSRLRP
jgi:hypothetical protein